MAWVGFSCLNILHNIKYSYSFILLGLHFILFMYIHSYDTFCYIFFKTTVVVFMHVNIFGSVHVFLFLFFGMRVFCHMNLRHLHHMHKAFFRALCECHNHTGYTLFSFQKRNNKKAML